MDVETTGLSREDRVVSLGMLAVDKEALGDDVAAGEALHLAFNPERPSDPRAAKVHGFSDWSLSQQDTFRQHASEIREWFEDATPVAHNASFDRRFIAHEFELAGIALPTTKYHCTMKEWRARHEPGSSAALKSILPQLGLARRGNLHGAFEDAWLAMQVFRYLQGLRPAADLPGVAAAPTNWREPSRQPADTVAHRPQPVFTPERKDYARYPLARTLSKLAAPTATLLMHIARADQQVAKGELDVVTELALAVAARHRLQIDDDIVADAVAELFRLPTYPENLRDAVTAIRGDQQATTELSMWARQMTMSDGTGSPQEVAAIYEISRLFAEARLNRGS